MVITFVPNFLKKYSIVGSSRFYINFGDFYC